jgi:hypothetical protein
MSPNSKNVLAFWSYFWLTHGPCPYLDLPSTQWDTYTHTGRGYIQSRFRGISLLDLESEYRFGITSNGFLGGVVFADVESVPDWPNGRFSSVAPGCGAGLRIKINKHSNTNLSVDYGFGLNGSGGLYVNLGELF